MSVVREEVGPTLPGRLGPRVRARPRAAQVALAALAALGLVAPPSLFEGHATDQSTRGRVGRRIAYNQRYQPDFRQVAPRGCEPMRLETPAGAADPQSLTATPFR